MDNLDIKLMNALDFSDKEETELIKRNTELLK